MNTEPSAAGADLDETLPENVKHVRVAGKDIYLVGTAHVSKQSVLDVRKAIDAVKPDAVAVELCEARYKNLVNQDQWRKTNIIKVIREGKAMLLLASLIMTSFQKRIGKQLGVTPGAEMLEAIHKARQLNLELALVDRDIQITLKRTWGSLNLWKKMKMLSHLTASLFVGEGIDEKTIEDIRQDSQLTDVLEMLARDFPLLKGSLIDERDIFLAQKIREVNGQRVVAVVGAGHVPGILRKIRQTRNLDALQTLPTPKFWPQALKWALPLLVIGLLVYGFLTGGTDHSLESIYIWVLVNGILSALGAALALGHPLTILSAFLAAPLTSLNPFVAAGWVSGLVQAIVRKPTVQDLEDLPEAITTVKGFWFNPVSRILLVVVFSNLGSSLGTFISGGWIAARTIP